MVKIAVMMLWNYFLTPIYMGYPREAVAAMLPTVFLPFNALITVLLYKPVIRALRKTGLAPEDLDVLADASGKSAAGFPIKQQNRTQFCVRFCLSCYTERKSIFTT